MPIIESEKFKFSSTFYAIDWSTLEYEITHEYGYLNVSVQAVWFKRQKGKTVCCIGFLQTGYNLKRNNLVEGK